MTNNCAHNEECSCGSPVDDRASGFIAEHRAVPQGNPPVTRKCDTMNQLLNKETYHEKGTDHFKQPQEKQQFGSIMQGFL